MKKNAIIVAAGTGKRFGSTLPKQFELLDGKPLLMYSIQAFYLAEPRATIVVVLHENFKGLWHQLQASHDFNIPHVVVSGGPERFHSVKNGLSMVEDGLVAIHDGARPLISVDMIKQGFKLAEMYDAVIPVIRLSDSLRMVDGSLHKPVDREKYRMVQTPQVFKVAAIKDAYRQPYDIRFTDDAIVAETFGVKVVLMDGSWENIKITTPEDLIIAQSLIEARKIKE